MIAAAAVIALALGTAVGCGLAAVVGLAIRWASPRASVACTLWYIALGSSLLAPPTIFFASMLRPARMAYPWLPVAIAPALLAVAAVVAIFGIVRLAYAVGAVRAIKASAQLLPSDATLARHASLRLSHNLDTPMAVGFLHPCVVIPCSVVVRIDDDELSMIVAHENAHLSRFDDWGKLVEQCACRVFWFNPAIWGIARRIDDAREMACDDRALTAPGDARRYAACLLRLFARTSAVAPTAWSHRSQLARRIEHLMLERPRRVSGFLVGAAAATIVAVALVGSVLIAPPLAPAPGNVALDHGHHAPRPRTVSDDARGRATGPDDLIHGTIEGERLFVRAHR